MFPMSESPVRRRLSTFIMHYECMVHSCHLQMGLAFGEVQRVVDALLDEGGESNVSPLLPLGPLGLGEI